MGLTDLEDPNVFISPRMCIRLIIEKQYDIPLIRLFQKT